MVVEIGDGFRLPDLVSTGARLREFCTTHRTTVADYAAAIGPDTGLVLKARLSQSLGGAEQPSQGHRRAVRTGRATITVLGRGRRADLRPVARRRCCSRCDPSGRAGPPGAGCARAPVGGDIGSVTGTRAWITRADHRRPCGVRRAPLGWGRLQGFGCINCRTGCAACSGHRLIPFPTAAGEYP
ncbi:hypothetical protein [Streptomyces glomeratus]|uniref:hypothetical protein n=1 Tax=Streptomyces glomeratus TaxID=284452 RepID=UPI00355626BC